MSNKKLNSSRSSQEVTITVIETIEEKTHQDLNVGTSRAATVIASVNNHQTPPTIGSEGTRSEAQRTPLPAKDNSRAAWQVLFAVILTQGMLFAFPLTFGVFQDYFSVHQRLSNSAHSIWIGVLSTGVPFIGAPFITALCENRSPVHWRYYVVVGWVVCTFSLIGAAFAKRLLVLGITQGVLYGVGLMLLDVPALLILNTWFIEHRGLAYGVLFGVTDLLGFGATILAGYMLRHHNLKRTLLTFAGILLVISGPCMWFLRYRPVETATSETSVSVLESSTEESSEDVESANISPSTASQTIVRYYRRPIFYIFAMANLFHALAYYLPFLYLPTYAVDLGLTSKRGAWLLAGANFAQIFGEIAFGGASDRLNINFLVLMCTLVSGVSAVGLWGPAQSFAMLALFALAFGAFGSGLIALWARMGTYFDQRDAQMIFSIMSFGRGFASILSGPISSALETLAARRALTHKTSKYGNGKYLGIVLFVGASMGISTLMAIIGLIMTWRRSKVGRHSSDPIS